MRVHIDAEERKILARRLAVEPSKVEDALRDLILRGPVAAADRQVTAQVTVEDVRRAFYDALPGMAIDAWSWIRQILLNPDEIICDDDNGTLYRVPFGVDGDAVTFGTPEAVRVEYVAAANRFVPVTSAGPIGLGTCAMTFADEAQSRQLHPPTPTRPRAVQAPGPYLNECEDAIAAAISAEKFSADRAPFYRRRWHRDPAGTARLLARLTPVPGLNSGAYDPLPAPTEYPKEWLGPVRQPRVRGAQD